MSDNTSELKTDIELARKTLKSSNRKSEISSLDDCLNTISGEKKDPELYLLEAISSLCELVDSHVLINEYENPTYSIVYEKATPDVKFALSKFRRQLEAPEYQPQYRFCSEKTSWNKIFPDSPENVKKYLLVHGKVDIEKVWTKTSTLSDVKLFLKYFKPTQRKVNFSYSYNTRDIREFLLENNLFPDQEIVNYAFKYREVENAKVLTENNLFPDQESVNSVFICRKENAKLLTENNLFPDQETVNYIFKYKEVENAKLLTENNLFPDQETVNYIFRHRKVSYSLLLKEYNLFPEKEREEKSCLIM